MKLYTPAQLSIANTFGTELYLQDQFCVMDWSLYDRGTTAAGEWTPEVYGFYSIPLGRTKSLADTNMDMANCLPMPQAFSLSKSLFFLLSRVMSDDDQGRLLENYHWELRMGRKCYAMGPLARFPNVCQFDAIKPQPFTAPVEDAALAARNAIWLQGQPPERRTRPGFEAEAKHRFDIHIPLVIEQQIYFSMQVVGIPFKAERGVNFICDMEGLMAMGIQ